MNALHVAQIAIIGTDKNDAQVNAKDTFAKVRDLAIEAADTEWTNNVSPLQVAWKTESIKTIDQFKVLDDAKEAVVEATPTNTEEKYTETDGKLCGTAVTHGEITLPLKACADKCSSLFYWGATIAAEAGDTYCYGYQWSSTDNKCNLMKDAIPTPDAGDEATTKCFVRVQSKANYAMRFAEEFYNLKKKESDTKYSEWQASYDAWKTT